LIIGAARVCRADVPPVKFAILIIRIPCSIGVSIFILRTVKPLGSRNERRTVWSMS